MVLQYERERHCKCHVDVIQHTPKNDVQEEGQAYHVWIVKSFDKANSRTLTTATVEISNIIEENSEKLLTPLINTQQQGKKYKILLPWTH